MAAEQQAVDAEPEQAASAPPSVLTDCTEQPFGHREPSSGEALVGAWFECDRARLYAARIEGPESFVKMMVESALDNQKRLARERSSFESVGDTRVEIPLGERKVQAWRVELLTPDKHRAIMVATSFVRDGKGFALLCVAPEDNADVACDHPFDDLMAYAAALPSD
jgi:hypothetical protein